MWPVLPSWPWLFGHIQTSAVVQCFSVKFSLGHGITLTCHDGLALTTHTPLQATPFPFFPLVMCSVEKLVTDWKTASSSIVYFLLQAGIGLR